MKSSRHSFSTRLSRNILIVTSTIFISMLLAADVASHFVVADEATKAAENLRDATIAKIENILQRVEMSVVSSSWLIRENLNDEEYLYHITRKMVEENPEKYFMPDQFSNAGNYMAHYKSTAIEIWQQTEGNIDYLVGAIGTSGTLMGLTKFLKIMNPEIKIVCAQPIRGHYIQGLKNMEEAIVPEIYNPDIIDSQEMIESEEAIEMARQIIAREGIFAGMSSGAALLAAVRTAEKIKSGNIVVVFPDRAEKYLSTTMFDPFAD